MADIITKETVYDEQIKPLTTQIIDICKEHGIAMICHFDIAHEQQPKLRVSTILNDGDGNLPGDIGAMRIIAQDGLSGLLMTILSGASMMVVELPAGQENGDEPDQKPS